MKYQKFIFGRFNPNLFFIIHENNLSTNVFLKCILAVEIRLFVVAFNSGSKWAKIPYTHCNFSRVCPPAKLAS